MGLLTLTHIVFEFRKDPDDPNKIQTRPIMDAGSRILAQNGIIVNVAIGVDVHTAEYFRMRDEPLPEQISCQALVDTGASSLFIDRSIAEKLRLARRGITTALTAAGPRPCNVYAVSLSFPGSTLRNYGLIKAADCDLSHQEYKCLIGRDVMSLWHIHYNGQTGTISIAD